MDITSFILRSDLEKAAFEKRKKSLVARLKKSGYDDDSINAKVKTFREEENHHNLEKLSFSSKEELLSFVRKVFGDISRKVAVRLLEEKLAYVEVVPVKEDGAKTWCFVITKKSHYRRMFNLPKYILSSIESFKFTQNLVDSELRLGVPERTMLVYLENKRNIMNFVWTQAYKKDSTIKWKPCLYISHATMAYDLGWTVDQVRYTLKKLSYYFGKDFFREPTPEEKLARKDPRSWNFQINLPPFREWNAIILRKVRLFIRHSGRSVLRKEYTKEEYKEMCKLSRKKKRNKAYQENSSNEGNKEYDRTVSLGRIIRESCSCLSKAMKGRKKRELLKKYFHDFIFGKPKKEKKYVPSPIASEYWRKKRASVKEDADKKKEKVCKEKSFYGTEPCRKSNIGLFYATTYGNYERVVSKNIA
mgnify:FL=1|jgi:hypothetical protein